MNYDVPGRADVHSQEILKKWNEMIQYQYNHLKAQYGSRFFSNEPESLSEPVQVKVKWFADPAEPNFCINSDVAQTLSDWGLKGRQQLHNEYCEYQIIYGQDRSGHVRPKRVKVSTELREYWLCIAMHDPNKLQDMAKDIIGYKPQFEDLYGENDPFSLTIAQRKSAFSRFVAGNGNDRELANLGIPSQPIGKLNTENVLFMTHPINGLDDLFYIVMFGAKPYAVRKNNGLQKATREQIFRQFGVEHLGCRHADPTAAMAAYDQAYDGKTVAFSNPLGVYILSFTKDIFLFRDAPVPDEWVRWSRGQPGNGQREAMWQHLEFGPSDQEPWFLDDISVSYGGTEQPLVGGFQLLQNTEVGPLLDIGGHSTVNDNEYVILNSNNTPIVCQEAQICNQIRSLKTEYDRENQLTRVAPRTMGIRI
jgi:hypothetical protein